DPISETIREKIKELKRKNNKKSILIIDDIDRLDPDHIFRILNSFNIFLGLDKEETEVNKNFLGFDKIIFVGDIKNIQSIFHHKYGAEADFEGYIDRFYSYIYDFDRELVRFSNYIFGCFFHYINYKLHNDVRLSIYISPLSDFNKKIIGEITRFIANTTFKDYMLNFRKLQKILNNGGFLLEDFYKVYRLTGNNDELEHYIFILTYFKWLLGGYSNKLKTLIEDMIQSYENQREKDGNLLMHLKFLRKHAGIFF
ncbi:MAG: P-loop NTPase fold protein, partial [Caldimicrobium sp.]